MKAVRDASGDTKRLTRVNPTKKGDHAETGVTPCQHWRRGRGSSPTRPDHTQADWRHMRVSSRGTGRRRFACGSGDHKQDAALSAPLPLLRIGLEPRFELERQHAPGRGTDVPPPELVADDPRIRPRAVWASPGCRLRRCYGTYIGRSAPRTCPWSSARRTALKARNRLPARRSARSR